MPIKATIVNNLIKAWSIINHKHFVEMTKIENRKKLLASIKPKDDPRKIFQQSGADISKLFGFGITASKYV